MGHPYYDVVDNSTDFENKIRRTIELIYKRIGKQLEVDMDDRLQSQSKKRKYLVRSLPDLKVSLYSYNYIDPISCLCFMILFNIPGISQGRGF